MSDYAPPAILWWVVTVDIPLISFFIMSLGRLRRDVETALTALRDGLSHYKLEVAQSYASIQQVKDLESRVIAHLLRIENKLDNSLHHTPRDKGV